jgi:outer membrane protein OmpA-like peptidoglycan-associated protein
MLEMKYCGKLMRASLSLCFLLTAVCCSTSVKGQLLESLTSDEGYANYVPNSGFEETKREYCVWNQKGRAYMEDVLPWDSPTEATPDILSLRLKPTCWANPRKHSDGKQGPRKGENMAGIKTYGKGGTDTFWHEYLMVPLDSALVPGQRYYAEMFVNRAVASGTASNNIGMVFSDTAVITRDRMPLFITPQINSDKVVKSRWNMWTKISGVFEVDSEKNYLLIGNFYHDNVTNVEVFPEGERGAYYYIDDVMVRRAKPTEALTPKPRISESPAPKRILPKTEIVTTKEVKLDSIDFKVGNTIKLDNIFFEFDKATLLPESKAELEKLLHILDDYPFLTIEISGHTDNVGTDEYNRKLSESRAKSVVDYLLEAKVEPTRLSYKGFGSKQPITTNDTEDGRAQNRRVQFTILSN